MESSSVLSKISEEIKQLTAQEQLYIVESIIHHLRKTELRTERDLDWSNLYGLGRGLWKGEDAQEYVDRLRSDRHDTR